MDPRLQTRRAASFGIKSWSRKRKLAASVTNPATTVSAAPGSGAGARRLLNRLEVRGNPPNGVNNHAECASGSSAPVEGLAGLAEPCASAAAAG